MPTCSICKREDRHAIEAAIVRGISLRHIASQFRCGYKAVERHSKRCVGNLIAERKQKVEKEAALKIEDELHRLFGRMNKLFDACNDWLTDPLDPSKYTVAPRADEILVTYLVPGTDKRRTATLQTLLDQVCKVRPAESKQAKHADPRLLIIKTAEQISKQLDLLARIEGRYRDPQREGALLLQWNQIVAIVRGSGSVT